MKTIGSTLTLLGIVTVIGGLAPVVNANPAPVVIDGGAQYFQNLGISNINSKDYEGVFNNNNKIVVTNPSFTIEYSANDPKIYPVSGINSSGTPQYTYNNKGVFVLQLGERERAIPYNRPGDASLLIRLDSGR